MSAFLRLTLALAVGLGLTPALHAKAGFVVELCSPEGAVVVVLDGPLPADCPDCPDCLVSGAALLPEILALADTRGAGRALVEVWAEGTYWDGGTLSPQARAPPVLRRS